MTRRRPVPLLPAVAAAVLLAAASGCAQQGKNVLTKRPPRPVARVDRIVLPTQDPVNWDGRPGADGLAVQVYFFRRPPATALAVTVTGTLHLALYEGPSAGDDPQAQPLLTWKFTAKELDTCLARAAWGWGYALRLGWGDRPPEASVVTLTARYVPPEGTGMPVSAKPTTLSIAPR